MRRQVSAAILVLALAACGGGQKGDAETSEPTTTAVESESEPSTTAAKSEDELTTTASGPTTTTASAAEAAPTLASPYLQGTLDVELPPGEEDQVSVIAVGSPASSTPVVVRNNTDQPVEVHLSGIARDAGGALVGSGEDQGVKPVWVEPGHIAIGYVYLGIDDPAPGTTIDITATGEAVDNEFGALPAVVVEQTSLREPSASKSWGS